MVCIPVSTFQTAKLKVESQHHQSDKRDAGEQTELSQPVFPLGFRNQPGDALNSVLSRSGDSLEAVFAEGMNVRASLFQAVRQFVQLVVDSVHVQAFHG